MDPVTLIVTALAAGVADAAKDIAVEEVPKAYQALKKLVINKLQSGANMKPEAAESLINEYEQDPESWEGGLKSKLKQAPLTEQDELVRQAQALLDLIKQYQPKTVAGAEFEVGAGGSVKNTKTTIGSTKVIGSADQVSGSKVSIQGSIDGSEVNIGGVEVNMDDDDE